MELLGEKFGNLTVTAKLHQDKFHNNIWECTCSCGNVKELRTSQLHKNKILSCGCTKQYKDYVDFKELKRFHWRRITENAKVRNIPLEISQEDAYNVMVQQGFKCALSSTPIYFADTERHYREGVYTASFDRIDNNGAYTIHNVQWLHKDVNRLKSSFSEEELQKWAATLFFTSLKKNRPSWDSYFMWLCKLVATRSIDPSTKHGCIIVDKNHRVVSVGYNGPPQGIDNAVVPLTRPEKYNWMIHAEENALLFCYQPLDDATVYITGKPCVLCLRKLIQKKVKKVVYGEVTSACIDSMDITASEEMINGSGIEVVEFTSSL
jgi:dCMP deaminase